MKHSLVFLLLAVTIGYFALKKSPVDKLMVPAAAYTEEQVGNRFVDIDPAILPVPPAYFGVHGVTTVVYFHDDTCHACVQLDHDLEDFLHIRPDVAVRKIHMSVNGNAYYKAIRDFKWKIYMAPSILLFDKNGKLIAADEGTDAAGGDLLNEWMFKEAEKAARSKAQ